MNTLADCVANGLIIAQAHVALPAPLEMGVLHLSARDDARAAGDRASVDLTPGPRPISAIQGGQESVWMAARPGSTTRAAMWMHAISLRRDPCADGERVAGMVRV